MSLMKTLKAAVDPLNIMNPGKVLPDGSVTGGHVGTVIGASVRPSHGGGCC